MIYIYTYKITLYIYIYIVAKMLSRQNYESHKSYNLVIHPLDVINNRLAKGN